MNGAAPWWGVLLSAAIAAAAALGGTVIATWRQNRRASREEWFRRVQWAQILTSSHDDATEAAGYRILARLGESDLATADDVSLIYELRPGSALDALVTVVAEQGEHLAEVTFVSDTEDDEQQEDR